MKSGWIIGLGVFVAGAVLSETVLIDADTNNRSFEEAMGGSAAMAASSDITRAADQRIDMVDNFMGEPRPGNNRS